MMLTEEGDGFTLAPDLVEALGIEDFTKKKDYGRERGMSPTPTGAQIKDIEKLYQKLNAKVSSKAAKKLAAANDDDEVNHDSVTFDLKSKPRVILFEAPVLKRSLSSMIQHHSKRHGYLLNDVLLITTLPTSSTSLVSFNSVERINIQQIFYLDQISIADLKLIDANEESTAFEIRTPDRPYIFLAESEADKKIWLEELEAAIFSIAAFRPNNQPGWYHEVVQGTFHSASYLGDSDLVQKYISRLSGQSLDTTDEAGMTPLHWASLNGHVDIVEKLLGGGAEIDHVNGGLNSALLLAAAFGHRDVVFCLLDHGADMNLRNLKDHDCLMMSVTHGSYGSHLHEIIMALKYRGVNVNRQDISGSTPLHECSSRSLPLSIQALVDAGADVNCKHGRTGLTPLQLACSSNKPDAETIRSLLDKGALPNWRDTLRRSAFDMVLFFKQMNVTGNLKNTDTSSPKGMKQTVEDVQQFVQLLLPALVELVRKGTRFTPESIEHLRDSFKEVLNSTRETWKAMGEPEGFADFVRGSHEEVFTPKNWTPDSASQCCLLCLDKFTYSNRRHHCRTCGVLCCDLCSQKRLHIKSSGGHSPPPSSGSNKAKEGSRVCDSCFNRYNFLCIQYHQNLARMKKEMLKREKEQEEANKLKLTGSGGKESPALKGTRGATAATAQTSNTMNETMKALEERGQRLENTAEKSEQLKEAASEFRKMTRQLLQQQQQKNGML